MTAQYDPFGRPMPTYRTRLMAAKARTNTYQWMRRHRVNLVATYSIPECELRAMWGDR